MAAAISRMRALPAGIRRTRRIRTTAHSTAATPPTTPNRTKLGSTCLSTNLSTDTTLERTARSERVSQPSTEHATAPPDHHAAEHHEARHEDAGDEDQGALVLLGQRQRKGPGGFGWSRCCWAAGCGSPRSPPCPPSLSGFASRRPFSPATP